MNFTKPLDFSFKNTIYSHGWSQLLPFKIDNENKSMSYVFYDKSFSKPISTEFSTSTNDINIEFLSTNVSEAEKDQIKEKIAHVLRLDEDLKGFYELTKQYVEFTWMNELKVGRLLRSPTVFEDLIKTICTTNCSWALTKNMVTNFVESLGEISSEGGKAFPTIESLANKKEKFYRDKIRAGYRSPYFVDLANSLLSGDLDPESWLTNDLPTNELKKEMKRIKGVGDYAAENLLKLVGRYDGLALDSFLRSEFYKKNNNGVKCSDKEIEKFYEKFGEYRGLAIWFDLTKRWFI